MHPSREPPPGTYGLVYDVDSDLTIASHPTGMWAYDLEANTWTEKGGEPPSDAGRRFYDPVSGHVVALGDDEDDNTLGLALWGYEVETGTWTPIPQAKPPVVGPHYEFFAYDASVDRLVAYARSCPYCENSANPPPPTWAATWLFDRWETLYEGSTAEDWWVACGTRPECRQLHFMVYDPVNERLVVYGGFLTAAEPEVELDDVLALDTRTREWTVLLEASAGQPAP